MTEIIDIELETTANPKTIEDQQYTINRTRWWTPVVIFTIGVALVIVMLGMSMWMTGLRSNISETEGGLIVPSTNLGSQDDPNLDGAGETVPVPDIIPEFPHEKDPNGENPTLSTNSRKSTTELVPSATSAENNRTKRQSMCEQFEPGCTPDKDPEPSDADPSPSETGSPDGSSCEMFEEDCPYNNPSDTKQPEAPKQPEVTEKETVPMEPLSNKTLTSLLMKWLNETHGDTRSRFFRWRNESAALPDDDQPNWGRAVNALFVMADLYSPSSTDSTWSLEEKRGYLHWAKWVEKFSPETPDWLLWNPDYRIQLEKIKTELHQLELQNLHAAPEQDAEEMPTDVN